MKSLVYLILGLLLLCVFFISESNSEQEFQMDDRTLINLLNFSRSLIHDGEIKFLFYRQFPTHPDDIGKTHHNLIANWEKQLRENPPKSKNSMGIRKEILRHLEEEKRFGKFRDSKEMFTFVESSLVFQLLPHYAYRMEVISRFEKYPSLDSIRFYNGGAIYYFFSNGSKTLKGTTPGQFWNKRARGYLKWLKRPTQSEVNLAKKIPPTYFIDGTEVEVHLLNKNIDETVYIITHQPGTVIKSKIYVRIQDGLPEVTREETYYKSDSLQADAEGYWLRKVTMYSDFERVESLNITVPKVREEQEFRGSDGYMRRRSLMIIKEMDFNLGLPMNYFDWDFSELNNDKGSRKSISGDILKKDREGDKK